MYFMLEAIIFEKYKILDFKQSKHKSIFFAIKILVSHVEWWDMF